MISEIVYLLPMMNQVEQWRKSHVGQKDGQVELGATVTTFSEWANSMWELWGDGRAVVKSLQRRALLLQLLKKQDVLPKTIGAAKLIGEFVSRMAGMPSFEAAVAGEAAGVLSDAEKAVFNVAAAYFEKLDELGLVEPGRMLPKLAETLPPTKVHLVGEHELQPNQEAFLHSGCMELETDQPYDPVICGREASSAPTILLPAGPSATLRMVFDEVCRQTAQCALIATRSAEAMLAQVGPSFADAGINVAARYSKRFFNTDFGRAYRAVYRIVKALAEENLCAIDAFADYLRSPYAGVRMQRAFELDARLRGDRRLSVQDAYDLVAKESPNFKELAKLFANTASSANFFIGEANRLYAADPAACAEEIAAINVLARAYEQVQPLVDSPLEIAELLEEKTINVSCALDPNAPVQVMISDLDSLGIVRPRSYSQVVLSHVTSEDFSMKTPSTALDTLMRKLGANPERDVLRTGRLRFNELLEAATDSFVIALPVNSGGDEDVYPAFFIEEYFDSLRTPDEEPDDDEAKRLNVPFGIPKALYPRIRRFGEGKLASNAFAGAGIVPEVVARQGRLDAAAIKSLLHFREMGDGRRLLPVLSPSQIELYISCPYRWFVSRKVKPDVLDAQFGPIERGNFAHRVFDETYGRMQQDGMPRVTKDNLADAQEILSIVFDEVLRRQYGPESDGYIPRSESERNEAAQLKTTLRRNLALHAEFLPDYKSTNFEYKIDPEQGIVFAGACIDGRIDRIDRAENGDVVVIDYKGSISNHECNFDADKSLDDEGRLIELPKKVQGLIYAGAVARLGLGAPVGALYLSYKAEKPQQFVRGAYGETKLDLGRMADEKSKVACGFSRYLELVEDAVAGEVSRMVAGDIAPAPRFGKDSCTHCPVVGCSMREA